jgi:ankyrin repeat protein
MTSCTTIDQSLLQKIATLLGVIGSKRWSVYQQIALSNEKIFHMVSDVLIQCNDQFNGMTLLHACCRHDPPVEIIAQMIRLRPELVSAQDCLGRTPLHIAAGCAAHPHVIKILAHADPRTCTVQDEDMRTPLHLACDRYCNLFADPINSEDSDGGREPSYDAIRALLSESLEAATLEDEDEMNPVEYAIMSNADLKVVKLLQKATQKAARTQKAEEVAVKASPVLSLPSKRRSGVMMQRRVSLCDSM